MNDVEIYRPQLVRSGLGSKFGSIPILFPELNFSAGGFDAIYGDKMSSALDIKIQTTNRICRKNYLRVAWWWPEPRTEGYKSVIIVLLI